jgi:branched-chain amino acid transport system substrate-binding protein
MQTATRKRAGKLGIFFLIFMGVFFLISVSAQLQAAEETITIGVVAPLSGGAGPIGQSQLAGAKVAAMHINEDGGILGRKVVIVERDSAYSPGTALKVTRDLMMNEKIKLFTGVASSAVALALAPLMEETDSVLILAAAQTEKATGINCNPHVFRVTTNAIAIVKASAAFAAERYPKIKRWGGICPDYEYGHSTWANFSKELKRIDSKVTIIPSHFTKLGSASFEAEILKLLEEKPEAIYCSLFGNDFITFVKQAKKYKLFDTIKVIINHSIETEVATPLGFDMVDVWGGGHYNYQAFNNPINKRFVAGHQKLYNTVPAYASSESYSAVYAFKYAIEKAKSYESKAIIKALRALSFDTVNGKRYFKADDHQAVGTGILTHFVPSTDAPGWKIAEFKTFSNGPFLPKVSDPEGGCKMKW